MIDRILLCVDPNKILDRVESVLNWIEAKRATSPFIDRLVNRFDDFVFKLVLWAMGQKNLNINE